MKRFCYYCGTAIEADTGKPWHFCSPDCHMKNAREKAAAIYKRFMAKKIREAGK